MNRADSFTIKVRRKIVHLFSRFYSDRKYLEALFPLNVGYKLNLDNPETYNEKLQWLKLYDRRPEYTQMVDKVEAKKYAANIIGKEHIIPTLAVYDRAEDIDFDALPDQFVLKCTHDSGGIVICQDKSKLDKKAAIKKLAKGLKVNYYYRNREWPYKNVKPRIIAEQYMSDGDENGLRDYKFFCFKGNPKVMFLLKNRHVDTRLNFYDLDFKKMPFERGYPNFNDEVEKPEGWDEMIALAEKLSQDIPQIRVDFYSVNGTVYFGELTFFPGSGMEKFKPEDWDRIMGDWIELPAAKTEMGGAKIEYENIIVEVLPIENVKKENGELSDYKWFCFNGEPKVMFIATDRFNKAEETKFDFYDMDFNHLPFTNGHPNATREICKPRGFEEMKHLASQLSKGIPHVRIDFYDIEGKIYFGEMTFFHWSGMMPFVPIEWDYKFGREIVLPTIK